MHNQLPLDTLIELAQNKTDEATRRLGELQNAQSSASEKLEMLLQYRQDYMAQLQTLMSIGIPCAHLRNFQQFVYTLDSAIEQQRALTQQAETQLVHGRSDWQSSKRRLTSFDTLADRVRHQELLASNKKEQRDNDERSARKFYMAATLSPN